MQTVQSLVEVVKEDPFTIPPSYEGLIGSLTELYSRRINVQHRFVYEVKENPFEENGIEYEGIVKVLRMWSRYKGF